MVSNMTAVVKSKIPACPMGKDFLLSSYIPFLDKSGPEAFSTRFQEDFQPFFPKKVAPFNQPAPAQVDHKDLRHIQDYVTEMMLSYQRYPLPEITRTPRWTKLYTNIKMPTDPRETAFLRTQSEGAQPQHRPTPPARVRTTATIPKMIQQVGKIPESTHKSSFILHHSSPAVKATVKHLEGFPTLKGDGRHRSYVSHYNSTFRGVWVRPVQPVEKHSSSVVIGDPEAVAERETTHAVSFSRPAVSSSQPAVKERMKLSLGNCSEELWSSTSRETFCKHQPGHPVLLMRRSRNFSSIPKGDTDPRRNKERTSLTSNMTFFLTPDQAAPDVHVNGADLMTKSHVQFSPPCQAGPSYTTTAAEHYSKKEGGRPRPAIQPPSKILSGPEHGLNLSTTKADFLRLRTRTPPPAPPLQPGSNIRFPVAGRHFSTSHREDYTAKPLILQPPACSQFLTHFPIQ